MPKCRCCGRRGIFLRLTPQGLCATCHENHKALQFDSSEKVISHSRVATITSEVSFSTSTIEVFQETEGTLPAIPRDAFGGYISPSGGYVNYGTFRVSAINPKTKRKNTRVYKVQSEEDAADQIVSAGFTEPITIIVAPSAPSSSRQLDYARALGAEIPEGACFADVSAIISRITDDDEAPVDIKLAKAAHLCGVRFSLYSGRKEILRLAAQDLPPQRYREFLRSM